MVKEIVFHLGDPKTGTTSIQEVLATGNWRSDGADLLYTAPINHLPLAATLHDPAQFSRRAERFTRLRRELEASGAETAVISAELFDIVDPALLRETLERYLPDHAGRVRLVAYVRPHAERLVSAYAERVKQGIFHKSLEAFHQQMKRQRRLFYAPRCSAWRDVFGARYSLRPMIRAYLKNGDVVQDFMDIVLRGRPFTIPRPVAHNESLTLADLAMLRALRLPAGAPPALVRARQSLGWNFARELAQRPPAGRSRLRLHKALAADVIATYRGDARAVDAAFFGDRAVLGAALEAAAESAVDQPQSLRARDHFTQGELRLIRAWAGLVQQMMRHAPETLPGHFRARQEARLRAAATAGLQAGPP